MAEESGYKATATSYPGVAFIVGTHPSTGKPDKIFYISYYRGGKRKHEKAGRASIDGMTAAKANAIRTLRMEGKELPNRDRRAAEEAARKAQEGRWTFDRLWEEWKKANGSKPSRVNDDNRYKNHLKDPFGDKEPRELVPLPLGDTAIRVLKSHQRVQHVSPNSDAAAALLEAGFHSASSLTQSQYVFAGEKGGPRGLRQIGESSRSIRDAAGLPADFRPIHGLRHTFASHLASSGEVDLYTLQRLMTHKSPIMTQRYAHLRDDTLKRGANVMSRIVREANEKAREKGRDGIA